MGIVGVTGCELRRPVGYEDIGFVGRFGVAIRSPHQLFAVAAEHGKAVEAGTISDLLQVRSIRVDGVKFEVAHPASRTQIRRKNNALAIGKIRGSKTGSA